MVQVVTEKNLESVINSPVAMIDFWATWCAPCHRMSPIVDELSDEYNGRAVVAKCNIEESDAVATKFQIMSIPTLLFFKDGKLVDKLVGVAPKETIKAKLDALL